MATSAVELHVTLNPSTEPNGQYLVGSDVSGEVVFKRVQPSTTPVEYSRIIVSIAGKAEVHIYGDSSGIRNSVIESQPGNQQQRQYHEESDIFYQHELVLWESSSSSTESTLPIAKGKFPFTFSLTPNMTNKPLPASMECSDGKIRYTITAKLIRSDDIEAAVAYTRIPVQVRVDINREDLMIPRATQDEITVSQFCVCQGSLCFTASIPRTGYCSGTDRICVVLKVDSDNANKLTSITSSLVKRTVCYADSSSSTNDVVLTSKQNTRLPSAGVSFSWNVPPIDVPMTDCSLTNCSIINIHYFIQMTFTGWFMRDHSINLPLIIGNVPYIPPERSLEPSSLQQSATAGPQVSSDYRPTLPGNDSTARGQYKAPFVPSIKQQAHNEKLQPLTEANEEMGEDQKLLK